MTRFTYRLMDKIITFSRTLHKQKYIENYLGIKSKSVLTSIFLYKAQCQAIAGWGYKSTTLRARKYATKKALPFIALDDGFLRSYGLGVDGSAAHSLCVDRSGIYYNTKQPSDLEALIIASIQLSASQLQRAKSGIAQIKELQLSKYNDFELSKLTIDASRPSILVVDQTKGDASIEYGQASHHSFIEMLETAITENPNHQIIVKVHPDVLVGKKKGYLYQSITENCVIVSRNYNPWQLFKLVDKVYVVTSQLGFEALMSGKQVHCFGMPFYAGWGLTIDKLSCSRRMPHQRSIAQVFYAAYIQYCQYINPYTNQRCQLEDTIRLLGTQKSHSEKYAGDWQAVGFSNRKQKYIAHFLGNKAKIKFTKSLNFISRKTKNLVWASQLPSLVEKNRIENGTYLMEDGFLRSNGLGANRVRPLSLIIDSQGIYYDATTPNDLEQLLNSYDFSPALIDRANSIRQNIVATGLSKYNVGISQSIHLPNNKTTILVPGQVESDASIKKGSPVIKTNHALLQQVRHDNPDAYIIYKPHPDVVDKARVSSAINAQLYDLEVDNISIIDLINAVDETHTMTSLTGFEALLRGKKVVTYGMPFYAGWGLTIDNLTCERRTRQLTIEQLVAGCLILYPTYVTPNGDICDVETAISLLAEQKKHKPSRGQRALTSTLFLLRKIGLLKAS